MPATDRRYVTVGIHWADNPDNPEFLAVEGKIVIFDTLAEAQEILPALMPGRLHLWDGEQETLYACDLQKTGYNRLSIWKGYDPYDVPNGFRSKGVYSEGEGRDWKYHVHMSQVIRALLKWADDMNPEQPFAEVA